MGNSAKAKVGGLHICDKQDQTDKNIKKVEIDKVEKKEGESADSFAKRKNKTGTITRTKGKDIVIKLCFTKAGLGPRNVVQQGRKVSHEDGDKFGFSLVPPGEAPIYQGAFQLSSDHSLFTTEEHINMKIGGEKPDGHYQVRFFRGDKKTDDPGGNQESDALSVIDITVVSEE